MLTRLVLKSNTGLNVGILLVTTVSVDCFRRMFHDNHSLIFFLCPDLFTINQGCIHESPVRNENLLVLETLQAKSNTCWHFTDYVLPPTAFYHHSNRYYGTQGWPEPPAHRWCSSVPLWPFYYTGHWILMSGSSTKVVRVDRARMFILILLELDTGGTQGLEFTKVNFLVRKNGAPPTGRGERNDHKVGQTWGGGAKKGGILCLLQHGCGLDTWLKTAVCLL